MHFVQNFISWVRDGIVLKDSSYFKLLRFSEFFHHQFICYEKSLDIRSALYCLSRNKYICLILLETV